jgi:rubrerythrin
MAPRDLLADTGHWICTGCGEVARGAEPPHDCQRCGGSGRRFEHRPDAALPSD